MFDRLQARIRNADSTIVILRLPILGDGVPLNLPQHLYGVNELEG